MVRVVYKICPTPPWSEAERAAAFRGSEADRRNGFIHFSMAAQVVETARKHFAGQGDLLLVSVDADRLGNRLRWEPSRGGSLFPHLYGDLDLAAVTRVEPLPLGLMVCMYFPLWTSDPSGCSARNCGCASNAVRSCLKNGRRSGWILIPTAA
jgi:uncharacterized protein (DUF952 family)